MCTDDVVKDRYHLVYTILCLLGVATLLPYNVFITETGYFSVRVHQPPFKPALADNFETLLVTINNAMTLAAYFVLVPLQHRLSVKAQVLPPLIAILGLLVGEASLARQPGASGDVVMGVTITAMALLGLIGSLLIVGSFAASSRFPPVYTQAVVMGQAIAGLAVSLLSFGSIWASPESEITPTPTAMGPAAFAYFASSAAVLAGAIGAFLALDYLPFAKYHAKPSELLHEDMSASVQPNGSDDGHRWLVDSRPSTASSAAEVEAASLLSSLVEDSRAGAAGSAPASAPATLGSKSTACSQTGNSPDAIEGASSRFLHHPEHHVSTDGRTAAVPLFALVQQLQSYALVIAFTFACTLAAFPGLTAAICSVRNPATAFPCHASTPSGRFYGDLFVPFLFVVFNAGDLAGRIAAGFGHWRHQAPSTRTLISYACVRWVFLPCLVFCHLVTPGRWIAPDLFASDVAAVGFNLLLGLTNGHLGTLTLMHAPRQVAPAARERAGTVMNCALTVGLMLGSVLSLVLTSTLQGR